MHTSDATPIGIQMRLVGEPSFCRLFFSADQRHAAAGVYLSTGGEDALQIGVFDRSTNQWTSNFVVKQSEDLWSKLSFDGFLGDTSKLVVTGIGKSKPREDVQFKVLLFGLDGQPAAESAFDRTLPRSNRSWDADAVDGKHNRLWFVGSPKFCPIKSVTLTGAIDYGPSINEAAVGGITCLPNVIGFPQAGFVVGGNTGKPELGLARRCGTAMPCHPFPRFRQMEKFSHLGDLSLHGIRLTEPVIAEANSTFIQSKPLKVLAVIPLKDGCGLVASPWITGMDLPRYGNDTAGNGSEESSPSPRDSDEGPLLNGRRRVDYERR